VIPAAFRRIWAPGVRAGRTGVVGKLRCAGAATATDRSQAGKRLELIGFPPEWRSASARNADRHRPRHAPVDASKGFRQPPENRLDTIARPLVPRAIPSDFMLDAAMNPCSCGHPTDMR
jgi:hypothetical protein